MSGQQCFTSTREAVRETIREKGANVLLPRVISEGEDSAKTDAAGIASQLGDKNKEVRLQASGYLLMMAGSRQDSVAVLQEVFPVIQAHFFDPDASVSFNAINVICSLNPKVPDDQLHRLADLATTGKRAEALRGIARMVNTSGFAYDFYSKLLSQHDKLTAAGITALGEAHSFNESLTREIAPLLNSDDSLGKAALGMIEALGGPAIELSRAQLEILAKDSAREGLATRAERLLETK